MHTSVSPPSVPKRLAATCCSWPKTCREASPAAATQPAARRRRYHTPGCRALTCRAPASHRRPRARSPAAFPAPPPHEAAPRKDERTWWGGAEMQRGERRTQNAVLRKRPRPFVRRLQLHACPALMPCTHVGRPAMSGAAALVAALPFRRWVLVWSDRMDARMMIVWPLASALLAPHGRSHVNAQDGHSRIRCGRLQMSVCHIPRGVMCPLDPA